MTVKLTLGTVTKELNPQNPRYLLGRDETKCELWVNDASVSRRHAEVFLQNGQVYIRDLGSSNGVWIDDNVYDEIPARRVGLQPIALQAHWKVWVGHAPLGVEWISEQSEGATVMVGVPPGVKELIAQHRQQVAQQQAATPQQVYAQTVPQPPAGSPAAAVQSRTQPGAGGALGVGGATTAAAAELPYRRQGSNNNGTLLLALPRDTFNQEGTIQGELTFTPTDKERVASIFVELIEKHKKGPRKGHVWDRCLVRQGPWVTTKDVELTETFELRVPPGPSISSPDCHWELRGYVDIDWALDIEALCPITMRNTEMEKIRDALGALDYRMASFDSKPLGQKYTGRFNPPAHMKKQLNITDIHVDIEYLGKNVRVALIVEKSKLFHFDKKQEFVLDLAKLRSASREEVSKHFQSEINKLMNK